MEIKTTLSMPSTTSRQVSVARLAQALGSLIQLKSSIFCSLRIRLIEAQTEQENNADRLRARPIAPFALSPFRRFANLPHPMKSYRKELWFETKKRREFIRIKPQGNQCFRERGIAEGVGLVKAIHITPSVFFHDNESSLHPQF